MREIVVVYEESASPKNETELESYDRSEGYTRSLLGNTFSEET